MLNVKCNNDYSVKNDSHSAGTVQMREESESEIRKWEEVWFKTTAEDGERGEAVSEWVSSFLTAHQHNIGYAVLHY